LIIHSAFFIFSDPNDQSAWIYERWLLLEHQRSRIRHINFSLADMKFKFLFTKELNFQNEFIELKLNGCSIKMDEKSIKLNKEKNEFSQESSLEWSLCLIGKTRELLEEHLKHRGFVGQIKLEMLVKSWVLPNQYLLKHACSNGNENYEYECKFSVDDLKLIEDLIRRHLSRVRELSELESGRSKWCNLSIVELTSNLDFDKNKSDVLESLDILATVIDPYRAKFYIDMKNSICTTQD
jgi:hypothetical protein